MFCNSAKKKNRFGYEEAYDAISGNANFLIQPLTLGMFVPAKLVDGVWVVLEEPKCECKTEYDREGCYEKCYEFVNAKNRVLFEGFELVYFNNSTQYYISNGQVQIGEYRIKINKFHWCSGIENIESLVKFNLELTPTAQKQIGL